MTIDENMRSGRGCQRRRCPGFYLKGADPSIRRGARWRLAAVLLAVNLLSGCTSTAYYGQAVRGHYELMSKRTPIASLVAQADLDPGLRARLALVVQVRRYAVQALGLPDNGSYLSYADLGRDYVVWNVFAAPEFSFELRQSCFPLIGCVDYRGYFHRSAAEEFAAGLRAAGLETYLGGVAAYSTLGWFDDPLLNTMLRLDDARLVRIILHELAHQKLYLRDDTDFNEAYATAVGEAGYQRFRQDTGLVDDPADAAARDREFVQMLLDARASLDSLYASGLPAAALRERKAAAYAELQQRYQAFRMRWNDYSGYDAFMQTELNNAKLASIASYHRLVPAFAAILASVNGNFRQFHDQVGQLADAPRPRRDACLALLLETRTGSLASCRLRRTGSG